MDNSLISCNLYKRQQGLIAFTTTRGTIMKMAGPRFTGEAARAIACRQELASQLNLDVNQLVFPNQTHSCIVAEVEGPDKIDLAGTDALITNKSGICLCIQTADCVPVLFYDPVNKVIAAAHAGWRGTVALIVKEVVRQLSSRFLSSPKNLLVLMGPSISAEYYEVGEEVAHAVLKMTAEPEKIIDEGRSGKFYIDLREANKQVLLNCGVPSENIEVSHYCTFRDKDLFFSARREGIGTGRLVSGILLE